MKENDKMENVKLEDIENIRIDIATIEKFPELDRKYAYINAGMQYIHYINQVENSINEAIKMIRSLVPEDTENIKILVARLEDIDPNKVDHLSMGFIKQTFTIDGKELKVNVPEVGDIDKDDVEFYRFLIKQIKTLDEQCAVAIKIDEKLKEIYNTDIPEDIRKDLTNVEFLDTWMIEYLDKKAELITDKKIKAEYTKKKKYMEYGYNMQPILDSVVEQVKTKGTDSILYNYHNRPEDILTAAINVCKKHNITFPFQLIDGVEKKLFGDKYKQNNLISYLIARYIKYKGPTFNQYDKVFITSLNKNLVLINRVKDLDSIPKTLPGLKKSMETILDLFNN